MNAVSNNLKRFLPRRKFKPTESIIFLYQISINNVFSANGGWSSYGTYTSCTVTCGGGLKYRTRTCTNPAPFGGGDSCSGSDTQSTACNTDACPTTTTTPVASKGTITLES